MEPEPAWALFSLPLHSLVCRELVSDDSCRPAGKRQCWEPDETRPAGAPCCSCQVQLLLLAPLCPALASGNCLQLASHCSWGGPWICSCPILPRGFVPMAGLLLGLTLLHLEGLAHCARFSTPRGALPLELCPAGASCLLQGLDLSTVHGLQPLHGVLHAGWTQQVELSKSECICFL